MADHETPNSDRSVHIGGNVTGSAVVTGDSNKVSIQFQQASLPQPETVDIQAELAALKSVLAQLEAQDQRKINNALEDAEVELEKPEPDKSEVGQALDRALKYAEKANGFAEAIDKLRPHVEAAAGWLGKHGYKLLPLVGLAL
jgi:predicted ribosome quality control (RQC) complex YloA/Tae2 family protein